MEIVKQLRSFRDSRVQALVSKQLKMVPYQCTRGSKMKEHSINAIWRLTQTWGAKTAVKKLLMRCCSSSKVTIFEGKAVLIVLL